MVYSEWLRIRNVLRCYGWVFLAAIVFAVIGRICLINSQMDINHWRAQANAAGAHVTTKTLADGTVETISDNPTSHVHIVIDDKGIHGQHISVTTGGSGTSSYSNRTNMVGVSVYSAEGSGRSTWSIDDEMPPIDIGYLFVFSILSGLVMATIMGAPLARENTDHLEVNFSRPVSRLRLAGAIILADLTGIIAAFVLTVIAMLVCISIYQVPTLTVSTYGAIVALVAVLASFAWYAMYLALSSWMKRGRGAILGLAWPAAFILEPLAIANFGTSGLGQAAHAIFYTLARLDPLAYVNINDHSFNGQSVPTTIGLFALTPEIVALVMVALTVIYLAAGLAEWQRVEA